VEDVQIEEKNADVVVSPRESSPGDGDSDQVIHSKSLLVSARQSLNQIYTRHSTTIKVLCLLVVVVAYFSYLVCAIVYNAEWAIALIVFTSLGLLAIALSVLLNSQYGKKIWNKFGIPTVTWIEHNWWWLSV